MGVAVCYYFLLLFREWPYNTAGGAWKFENIYHPLLVHMKKYKPSL